jgi:hypothetical protein
MVYLEALLAGLAALVVLSVLTLVASFLMPLLGVRLLSSEGGGLCYVILLSVAVSFWISKKGHNQDTTHAGSLALATGGFAGLACVLGFNAVSLFPNALTLLPLPMIVGISVISALVFASFVGRRRPS